MEDFHDLLKQIPSSLFMLLWSFISIASLMVVSMYLDLEQTVLMLWRWIYCLRLRQCLSSYYVCLFLLVQQPPISSSLNLLAFHPSHPHLYFHFYTHTHIHMHTWISQTFISISPFSFPHRHPMPKPTLFLTVFQFTPLKNRILNGPILFLRALTCPTHPPTHHSLLAQPELCPGPPCPHIHFCLQLLQDGGSSFPWNVHKYLQTTQQIPEDDHVDVNKVFNTSNFDALHLITKHVDLKVSNLCFVLLNQYCSSNKIENNKMGGGI